MKAWSVVLLLGLILTFCACAVKEPVQMECVTDTLPADLTPTFYLQAEIPQEAALVTSAQDGQLAVFEHEDYEVLEEVFSAASLDEALVHLTGLTQKQLQPLVLSSYPQREYRFSWAAAGELGTLSCSGVLLFDGTHYYALTVQCPTEKEKEYRETFSALLSGVSLRAV